MTVNLLSVYYIFISHTIFKFIYKLNHQRVISFFEVFNIYIILLFIYPFLNSMCYNFTSEKQIKYYIKKGVLKDTNIFILFNFI